MRGGLRYGAGRPGWNGKVESLLNIDIRQWASKGLLVPGKIFGWHWSRGDEKIASIGVRVLDADNLILQYNWTPDGEDAQPITEAVGLLYTPCNYGGKRTWFACPMCKRRVAKLYSVRGRWYCRKSLNVAYSSQSMDVIDRMHRRMEKLKAKLGENYAKPKGMHRVTYERIFGELDDAETNLNLAVLGRMQRLLGLMI